MSKKKTEHFVTFTKTNLDGKQGVKLEHNENFEFGPKEIELCVLGVDTALHLFSEMSTATHEELRQIFAEELVNLPAGKLMLLEE